MSRAQLMANFLLLALRSRAVPGCAGSTVSVCTEAHLKTAVPLIGSVLFNCSGIIGLASSINASTTLIVKGG